MSHIPAVGYVLDFSFVGPPPYIMHGEKSLSAAHRGVWASPGFPQIKALLHAPEHPTGPCDRASCGNPGFRSYDLIWGRRLSLGNTLKAEPTFTFSPGVCAMQYGSFSRTHNGGSQHHNGKRAL